MPRAEDIKPLRAGGAIRALEALHLLRPAYRIRRRLRTLRFIGEREPAGDGLPVPPARLRFLVGDNANRRDFLVGGRLAGELIETRLASLGIALGSLGSFLDFGCGCGRIARHWERLSGPDIHACDANPRLTRWCAENLPHLRCIQNDLEPPLPYSSGSLDLIYAFSVLTHLPPDAGEAWVAEFERVLGPSGILVVTHHGDRHAEVLSGAERELYEAGRPVSQRVALAGTNGCSTFAPPEYVRQDLLGGFEILDFVPGGKASGTGQDLYIARRAGQEGASYWG